MFYCVYDESDIPHLDTNDIVMRSINSLHVITKSTVNNSLQESNYIKSINIVCSSYEGTLLCDRNRQNVYEMSEADKRQ